MKRRLSASIFLSITLLLNGCTLPAGGQETVHGSEVSGPQVWFDSPLSGSSYPLGPVEVVSHFSDPSGVAEIELDVNGEIINTTQSTAFKITIEGLVTDRRSWTPENPGQYTLRIRAKGKNDSWGPYAETVIQIVIPEIPTEEPTAMVTTGIIAGVVFADQNGNGMQEADEGPLEEVKIVLKGCGPDVTQYSEQNGSFQFADLPAGACTLEVSKDGWNFSGSSPDLGYPLPVASDPNLPTEVGLLMAPVVQDTTPEPNFGEPQLSNTQVYFGTAGCDPNSLTVKLEAHHPGGIRTVVFFHRLHELNSGKDSGWSDGISMDPAGQALYTLAVSGNELVASSGITAQAIASYQFVLQTQTGEFLRSEVYSDLYLSPCGSIPPPKSTNTPGIIIIPPIILASPTPPVVK